VYNDIYLSNANVTFNPGIYIITPTSIGQGLTISGGQSNITANGAMFYLTGSDYLPANGKSLAYYDLIDTPLDGPLPPTNGTIPTAPDPAGTVYASLNITTGNRYHQHDGFAERRESVQRYSVLPEAACRARPYCQSHHHHG
jgi:hypothetical protein